MKILPSRFLRVLASILFLFVLAVAPLRAADDTMVKPVKPDTSHLHYLPPDKPDFVTLLAPPPLADSPEQAAEMAEVQAVFHAATSNEITLAYSQKKFSAFSFTPAIGVFFQSNSLPKTTGFMEKVQTDAEAVTDSAKDYFKRPRPYTVDPTLANGKLEKSFGYPSGHSTEATVLALVLADLVPDKSNPILAEGRAIGWHRVQIARHYPTDIFAGRILAQAIVHQMKENPNFQKEFAEAKAEIAAAQTVIAATPQLQPQKN